MQATITYLLTEQAQRAQMMATGQPVARKQTTSVEISAEDLELFPISANGQITVDMTLGYRTDLMVMLAAGGADGMMGGYTPDQIAAIATHLRAGRAKRAEEEREKKELCIANGKHNSAQMETAYRAFLADPTARGRWARDLAQDLRSPADSFPCPASELQTEIERRNNADHAAKLAADKAKEQAKLDYIAQWIASLDAEWDDLKQQFTDGLLCRQTALSLISDMAFAVAGVPIKTVYDICDSGDCPCGEKELDCLPTTAYPAWKAIKVGLPDGYSVSFLRVRECLKDEDWEGEGESAGRPMYLAKIKLPHGPFVFERTVRL
jgi:hypothetical protein